MFGSSRLPGKQSLYSTRLLTPGLSLKGLICNKQMAIVYLAKNKNKIRRFYGSCHYKVSSLQSFLLRTTPSPPRSPQLFFEMTESISWRDEEVLYKTLHIDIPGRLNQESSGNCKALCFTSKRNKQLLDSQCFNRITDLAVLHNTRKRINHLEEFYRKALLKHVTHHRVPV